MTADWTARLAGTTVTVVGVLNLAVAVLAWTTGLVRISAGAAGGFLAAGVAVVVVGVLIWRGSRAATILGLALFAALLVLQVGQAMSDPGADDAAVAAAQGDEYLGRIGVLVVLTATCALAAWQRRRVEPRRTPGPGRSASVR